MMAEDRPLGEDEGMLREIDASVGDRKIRYDRKDPASVAKAKAKFEELKKKGYAFFRTKRFRVTEFPKENGGEIVATKSDLRDVAEEKSEHIKRFEPARDQEVVAVPPRRGG